MGRGALRAGSAAALAISLMVGPGWASAATHTAPVPGVAAAGLSTTTVSAKGGFVAVRATIKHAGHCVISSTPSLFPLPMRTSACAGGSLVSAVYVGAAPNAASRRFQIKVTAVKGSHRASRTLTLIQLAAPAADPTPIPTPAPTPTPTPAPPVVVPPVTTPITSLGYLYGDMPTDGLRGSTRMNAVTCPAAAYCVAVGEYGRVVHGDWTGSAGLVATFDDGKITTTALTDSADDDRSVELESVSCVSVNSCVAVGHSRNSAGNRSGNRPYLALDVNGVWHDVPLQLPVDARAINSGDDGTPDGDLVAVSCPADGGCVAVGAYDTDGSSRAGDYVERALIAQQSLLDPAVWTLIPAPVPADVPAGLPSSLDTISCPVVAVCTAGGSDYTAPGIFSPLGETSAGVGVWLPAQLPTTSKGSSEATSIACLAPGTCTAIVMQSPPVIDTQIAGLWVSADTVNIPLPGNPSGEGNQIADAPSIDCHVLSGCAVAGTYSAAHGNLRGFVDEGLAGTFSSTEVPSPPDPYVIETDWVNGIACAGVDECVVTGAYQTAEDSYGDVIYTQTPSTETPGLTNWAPQSMRQDRISHPTCVPGWGCIAVGANFSTGDPAFVTLPS